MQSLPLGSIIDDVRCRQDETQRYALYLPSYFKAARHWPVILAFDGGGGGREGVECYRDAAETYGFVVAGSNNSRNGPWNVGLDAAAAMTADVRQRVPIDPKRMYTAGMSGGARVAIMVAQKTSDMAGVFASSAGYSTAFQKSELFPIFGTAGTEDFNYREMRMLDRLMTSPHRVVIFEGGHTWPPVEVATSGVEWMEILAMKSGARAPSKKLVDELFSKRLAHAEAQPDGVPRLRELQQIGTDFEELRNLTVVNASVAALEKRADIVAALRAEEADDAREARMQREADLLTRELGWPERADAALNNVKSFVASLLDVAGHGMDSSDRRIARRVLSGLHASRGSVANRKYQEWMQEIQGPAPPPSR